MSFHISSISALEILDSRGVPTVQTTVTLENGIQGTSSVPSGASTGAYEAVELRDGDPRRYAGRGVLRAVSNVEAVIGAVLRGKDVADQERIDHALIQVDDTPDKSNLGANAMLSVSQACARASAAARGLPLYAAMGGREATRLPMPMVNIINGGKHADSTLDIQEFMIVPIGAPTFAEALRYCGETFHTLKKILLSHGYSVAVGDEGGFAPLVHSNEEAFELIIDAISQAGYKPGVDIALALDSAATSFYEGGRYKLARTEFKDKSSEEMIALYRQWIDKYPIISLEDPLAETDWSGFRDLTAELGSRVQVVGDDILVTNTRFIRRAVEEKTCNAALIKLNQIGTVTETVAAISMCRSSDWSTVVSHRSGETGDSFLADFAVAMDCSRIKAGSVCRGERVAKYNRLLEIERELGDRCRFHR